MPGYRVHDPALGCLDAATSAACAAAVAAIATGPCFSEYASPVVRLRGALIDADGILRVPRVWCPGGGGAWGSGEPSIVTGWRALDGALALEGLFSLPPVAAADMALVAVRGARVGPAELAAAVAAAAAARPGNIRSSQPPVEAAPERLLAEPLLLGYGVRPPPLHGPPELPLEDIMEGLERLLVRHRAQSHATAGKAGGGQVGSVGWVRHLAAALDAAAPTAAAAWCLEHVAVPIMSEALLFAAPDMLPTWTRMLDDVSRVRAIVRCCMPSLSLPTGVTVCDPSRVPVDLLEAVHALSVDPFFTPCRLLQAAWTCVPSLLAARACVLRRGIAYFSESGLPLLRPPVPPPLRVCGVRGSHPEFDDAFMRRCAGCMRAVLRDVRGGCGEGAAGHLQLVPRAWSPASFVHRAPPCIAGVLVGHKMGGAAGKVEHPKREGRFLLRTVAARVGLAPAVAMDLVAWMWAAEGIRAVKEVSLGTLGPPGCANCASKNLCPVQSEAALVALGAALVARDAGRGWRERTALNTPEGARALWRACGGVPATVCGVLVLGIAAGVSARSPVGILLEWEGE